MRSLAIERLPFAGRAGDDEPVVAAFDEPAREALRFARDRARRARRTA